ncbi:uncharacterized protein EHS24_000485 [Apiotrichum porosum]|uniref:Cytochrome b5 heme-binding domain-containing protein n=1 Tax=Apiotrichum porosum TaxID=105984 RepID=A0A427YA36_9TREE|nr:uncharacterized protein EHS24_000485 [Apiotrichum porosum]RSH87962.1 hypothetical protein EHS24_000485 [Apiotrichum porosum]
MSTFFTQSMWYDIVTNWRTLIVVGLGIVSAAAFWKIISAPDTPPAAAPAAKLADNKSTSDTAPASKLPKASIMSAPATNLNPPKSDPISVADLAQYNGEDASKPIYVAIKGNVYDVSAKTEMYGKGSGYNVFAGKDASRGLGMSSLDPKDAVADYSPLNEAQMKTLDGWETFFQKRYNVIGKVVP